MVRYCPIDAYSLAVACGSRGVSLDIWPASHSAPAAPRAVRLSGHDRDRSPSRTTRRATTWFPPRRSARQARGPSRALAAPLAVVVRLRPRATANVAYGAMRCVDRVRCCFAARHLVSTLGAAITRRALRPGNVACGDCCVRGTLAPRHHAGTNDLLSKALGATGRKAAFAPRHYRIAPPGDMPRKATSAASDRRPVVTGVAPQTPSPTGTAVPPITATSAPSRSPEPLPAERRAWRSSGRGLRGVRAARTWHDLRVNGGWRVGRGNAQGFAPDLAKPAAWTALGTIALATLVGAAGVERVGHLRATRRHGDARRSPARGAERFERYRVRAALR